MDYLVLEATYGDRLHESTEDAMERLAQIVTETARRGGKIVIPAFAIERTQELVYYFHMLLDEKKIPDISHLCRFPHGHQRHEHLPDPSRVL